MSLSKWGEHNQVQPVNIETQCKTQNTKKAQNKTQIEPQQISATSQNKSTNRKQKHRTSRRNIFGYIPKMELPVNEHKLCTHFLYTEVSLAPTHVRDYYLYHIR